MRLSVIVPCYNAEDTLAVQLDALCAQEWSEPWEVLLVDNRSTDKSLEIAKSYLSRLPNLRIVDASAQQGQTFALNTGVRAALAESVALCDADDEIAPGWVAAMGEALAKHEFIACRIDTEKLNPKWLQGHDQEKGLQKLWYPPYMIHAGGGTLGFRKKLFEEVGDFDDSLPCLHDTDFCFRAQKLGYHIHFVPEAVLHVRKRDSTSSHYKQSRNYAIYNTILAKRYWTPKDRVGPFIKAFLYDCYKLVRNLSRLRTISGRFWLAWDLGRQVGRFKGMIKHGGIPV